MDSQYSSGTDSPAAIEELLAKAGDFARRAHDSARPSDTIVYPKRRRIRFKKAAFEPASGWMLKVQTRSGIKAVCLLHSKQLVVSKTPPKLHPRGSERRNEMFDAFLVTALNFADLGLRVKDVRAELEKLAGELNIPLL